MAEDIKATTSHTHQSILFRSEDSSVVLIDVPRSIEEGQLLSSSLRSKNGRPILRRLVSSEPHDKPFQTPEPKDGNGGLTDSISDLMSAAAATHALEIIRNSYSGLWCLPRTVRPGGYDDQGGLKRKREVSSQEEDGKPAEDGKDSADVMIPECSFYLHGTITAERDRFLKDAPTFDLIVLDPPWPNRSARRKKGNYKVADSLATIRETLSLIPIAAHLAPGGLVAVWVTNKASAIELLTGPRGLFAEWALEQLDEWTWLKVTTAGEPIFDVNSTWRKPWERILIARRRGSETRLARRGRVIVSVPDLHSRKPNLRGLFEDSLHPDFKGLEVFARNLTANWWGWGDEVLRFQQPVHWAES